MATAHAQRRAPAGASAPRPTGPDAGLAPAHRSAARRASRESAHRRTRSRAAREGPALPPARPAVWTDIHPEGPASTRKGRGWLGSLGEGRLSAARVGGG